MTALKNLEKLEVYPSVFMVSLGVDGLFDDWPHFFRFPLTETLSSPDGTDYERFEVHIYNYDPTLAPEGKTVITVSFYTKKGDFWIELLEKDKAEYDRLKHDFAGRIIDLLNERMAGIREKIEVVDVATPATFYGFTNNWKGSVQGWFPGKNLAAASPVRCELPGLKNFYYSSHWSIPGGGTPVALKSARDLVQTICHKYGIKFKALRP
jgi:phytoene dehydrogenase-like protein